MLLLFTPRTAVAEEDQLSAAEQLPVPFVTVQTDEGERSGYPLSSSPDVARMVLLGEDGQFLSLSESAIEVVDRVERMAARVPSRGLVQGLSHEDAFVRDSCQWLLEVQGPLAVPYLGPGLASDSADVRRRTLLILEEYPSRRFEGPIRANLNHRLGEVRRAALAAYAALEPDDLVDRSAWILSHDPASRVCHEAIEQLGRSRDLHAVDPLIRHLEHCEERGLRLATFSALRRLTGQPFGRNERHWRNWWSNHGEELLSRQEAGPDEADPW